MRSRTLLVVCGLGCLAVLVAAGGVTADHDPDTTNYTVFADNHSAGAEEVDYSFEVELTDNIDNHPAIAEAERIAVSSGGPEIETCGDSGAFGIGDNYELFVNQSSDDGFEEQDFDVDSESWDDTRVEFELDVEAGEDDNQPEYSVNDTLVMQLDGCVTNPDAEGWYQADVLVEGTSRTGWNVTLEADSHYFGICDGCENYSDAREQLGPSPAEGTPTPTPTPEGTATPTPTETPTPTTTPAETPTPTPESTPAATPEATPTDEPTATPTADETATPGGTPADGAGPGGVLALIALLTAVLLRRGR